MSFSGRWLVLRFLAPRQTASLNQTRSGQKSRPCSIVGWIKRSVSTNHHRHEILVLRWIQPSALIPLQGALPVASGKRFAGAACRTNSLLHPYTPISLAHGITQEKAARAKTPRRQEKQKNGFKTLRLGVLARDCFFCKSPLQRIALLRLRQTLFILTQSAQQR